MGVRVTNNTPQIMGATRQKIAVALEFITADVIRTAYPKTPKDTGDMARSTLRQIMGTKATIKWLKHYARYQERGVGRGPIRNYTTPGTGPHFAEESIREVVRRSKSHFRKAGLGR